METVSLRSLAAAAASPRALRAILSGPPERTAAWVAAAAENGIVDAQAVYGQVLLDGRGVPRDPAAALVWFRHAARADHPMAMNMLGRCYEFGWGTAACATVAVYWYRLAARAGLDWGMYNYATALALGNGVAEDRAGALAWFRRAAALGHAKSTNLIGGFYEDGWVVPADRAAAFEHYRRAAEAGDFRGQFNYARLLVERGRVDDALAWLARVPDTATPAFVAKMRAYLAASPVHALREAAAAFDRGAFVR
ncbi:tetratricopeptide repeat protein [Burkholderia guangdongensis]|uniref:tetratricopeptide repeat protein n=1 Tax=Burkholderia guangdongensis TaxID=1792500 RepID=UPI0015C7C272|nr:tetratricopeptide repeat protein [Burkholderia guangdongensis]